MKNINVEDLYRLMKTIEIEVNQIKKQLKKNKKEHFFLADEELLAEDWLSPEDNEAWKNL